MILNDLLRSTRCLLRSSVVRMRSRDKIYALPPWNSILSNNLKKSYETISCIRWLCILCNYYRYKVLLFIISTRKQYTRSQISKNHLKVTKENTIIVYNRGLRIKSRGNSFLELNVVFLSSGKNKKYPLPYYYLYMLQVYIDLKVTKEWITWILNDM